MRKVGVKFLVCEVVRGSRNPPVETSEDTLKYVLLCKKLSSNNTLLFVRPLHPSHTKLSEAPPPTVSTSPHQSASRLTARQLALPFRVPLPA